MGRLLLYFKGKALKNNTSVLENSHSDQETTVKDATFPTGTHRPDLFLEVAKRRS